MTANIGQKCRPNLGQLLHQAVCYLRRRRSIAVGLGDISRCNVCRRLDIRDVRHVAEHVVEHVVTLVLDRQVEYLYERPLSAALRYARAMALLGSELSLK